MDQTEYQYFLSVSLLTMALTPFLIAQGNPLATKLLRILPSGWARPEITPIKLAEHYNDHIVIIGFGLTGQHIARTAKQVGITYNILELNAETVRRERLLGEPIIYGDAVHPIILNHLGISQARIAVVAISDSKATKQIVANIRSLSSTVHIIARTSFVTEVEENLRMGADEVIPEELETSVEIFTRVLNKYLVPKDDILAYIDRIRAENYTMMRSFSNEQLFPRITSLELASMTTVALKATTTDPAIIGKTLEESDIRKKYGITILAIKRKEELLENIYRNTEIFNGDLLYVFGRQEAIQNFEKILKNEEAKA